MSAKEIDNMINTIKFSEIAQKGYKIMSNDEFDKIVEGVLNLQQENKQLKQALLDIKEYIEKYSWQEDKVYKDFVGNYHIDKYMELNQDCIEELLDILNKAIGSDK